MHVHLPKALHGWREFLGEVGIIVLGVLIALGAEQVVTGVRLSHETDSARQALRKEAADSLHAAEVRIEQQPCVERRLNEVALMFADHAHGRPFTLHGSISRPISYYGGTDAWQVEVASEALAHMPLSEKLAFATAFSNYDNMNSVLRREQEAWLRLNVLDAPDQLEAGDWPGLRQAYAEARSLSARLQIITADVLANENLGQSPNELEGADPAAVTAARKQFCKPILG
jgi:hypothetical protein